MIQKFDLLDLTIELTAPPQDSPAEAIASIMVRCEALGLNHIAGLLADPLTEAEHADLRWYLEEYPLWPFSEFAERGKRIEAQLATFGQRLYQAAFGSILDLVQSWQLQPARQRQISIVSTVPAALSLPWELLHDERGFLVLRVRQPITLLRRLAQRNLGELLTSFVPPLRVLLVTARPSGTGFIDPRSLARELLDAVQSQIEEGAVEVEFLRPPTRAALRTRLRDTSHPVHILHFDGHGVFTTDLDPQDTLHKHGGGQGLLAFENEEGALDLVPAEDLGQLLQDSSVKLVILDACQSAMSSVDDAFSSVAARLIKSGVDATIAMSASVLVVSSTHFFAALYRELATGTSVPLAQERARQALYDDPHRHLFRLRPDEEGQPVSLRDWWLPHYYQQRPLRLRATKAPRRHNQAQRPNLTLPRFNDAMPPEPRYSFRGRAFELLQIERHLLRNRLVVVSGFGGIGKTALVREAAAWLTRTGLYASVCFVSCEQGGDASTLLSELGTFLNITEAAYDPQKLETALALLPPILVARPTLVIADNLESLLPGGEFPLGPGLRAQLWQTLLALARAGAGVLLTSRDPLTSEALLAPGSQVAHLPLRGLTPDDAYALASRLFTDLGIDRARAPYAELRDLLIQLDHHPLAIQLVLPTLRERTMDTIQTSFAALLPHFTTDTVSGHNRSLLASLEYSLRRLSEAQRTLLPYLALFEGGANESCLLDITEISETAWSPFRQALAQAALLIIEPLPGWNSPYLHFHPILTPYLRSQPGASPAPDLQARFIDSYTAFAASLYQQDTEHPQRIRAMLVRELPNLRAALSLLLASEMPKHWDQMVDLAAILTSFLDHLGLWRERAVLRQQVNLVMASVASGDAIASSDVPDMLTRAVYRYESELGKDEYRSGAFSAAADRFSRLLARIEALPADAPLGTGSYEHAATLLDLAHCQRETGHLDTAVIYLRRSVTFLEALLQRDQENAPIHQSLLSTTLRELAHILTGQERYIEAGGSYSRARELDRQRGDLRAQAVSEGGLGKLALAKDDYATAQQHYQATLATAQALNEPQMEAVAWHQLGLVAKEQNEWGEAERCYRESLILYERLGYATRAADTCTALGRVARKIGRPDEAEGWFRRTLAYGEQTDPGLPDTSTLYELADLLVDQVQAKRSDPSLLTEAKRLAEQALTLQEKKEDPAIYNTLDTLAQIAILEHHLQDARSLRHRMRDIYTTFSVNRSRLLPQWNKTIWAIATAQSNPAVREKVEASLPEIEARGWHLADAVHRLWSGERDWEFLADELDGPEALVMQLVLEALSRPSHLLEGVPIFLEMEQMSAEYRVALGLRPRTPDDLFNTLPPSVQEAFLGQDEKALSHALDVLTPRELTDALGTIEDLQALMDNPPEDLTEPLVEAIATIDVSESAEPGYGIDFHEFNLGTRALKRGAIREAFQHFTSLLTRIEGRPSGTSVGRGSFFHAQTLGYLGQILEQSGHPAGAETWYRQQLAVIEALIAYDPENHTACQGRGSVLTDLAHTLKQQGKYSQAQEIYEVALEIWSQMGDQYWLAITQSHLGSLAMEQAQ
jgi:tetratricopeptide (TPR) repeat protein